MSAAIEADFKTSPYFHQLREFEISADMPARALLWQMRTGKTKVIIDTAFHNFKEKRINLGVIIAPNGVHENWIRRELPIHGWDTVETNTLVWRTSIAGFNGEKGWLSKEDYQELVEKHALWWEDFNAMLKSPKPAFIAFNSESLTRPDIRKVLARLIKRKDILSVFDESQDFRSPGSKRTKMVRAMAPKTEMRRILTGTPVTNSPLHAWAQFELLEPRALGYSRFKDFKYRYAYYEMKKTQKGTRFPQLIGYKNLEELTDRMAPWSSLVTRDECGDLPAIVRRVRKVDPTDVQREAYRELVRSFIVDLNDNKISVGEDAPRFVKLQQIMSGFLIDEYKDIHTLPGFNPRLEALVDEVFLSSGKVIIWCQFKQDIRVVSDRLKAEGYNFLEYYGLTSDDDKAEVRRLMAPDAEENDIKGVVGQAAAGGKGLDFSSADMVIWYSHTFDAIIRDQADERATAMGGGNVQLVDLVMPGPDVYILESQERKMNVADRVAGQGLRAVLERISID